MQTVVYMKLTLTNLAEISCLTSNFLLPIIKMIYREIFKAYICHCHYVKTFSLKFCHAYYFMVDTDLMKISKSS